MQHDTSSRAGGDTDMHLRRIILPDGRYMIFYTFGDLPEAPAPADASGGPDEDTPLNAPQPPVGHESQEEQNV